jgi:hypothetical protein
MATVRAQCPRCGTVRLRARQMTVLVRTDTDERTSYRFGCPFCGDPVVHGTTVNVCALLARVGAREERWMVPAEVGARPGGPPLTADDALELHLLLQRDDWQDQLTS